MEVLCPRCERNSTGPEEWAARLDGMIVERWRCGLCGYAISVVKRPPRSSHPSPLGRMVIARWEGINGWIRPTAADR